MAPLVRLILAVLNNIVEEEWCCYSCPLCELTGIDTACEHPDEVIAFALDSDPLVIESIVSEVKRNAKP